MKGGAPWREDRMADRILVRPYGEIPEVWHGLISVAANVTLYHTEAWIRLISGAYGLPLSLATIEQDGQTAAGCILARSRNPFVRRFVALPFSDSCPPLAPEPEAAPSLLAALAARAAPSESYEIRGIASPAPWKTIGCFAQWWLALDRPLRSIEQGLAPNFRRNLRRAVREAITMEHGGGIELVRRFYALQLHSRRRLGLPPQPWKFFKLMQQAFAPKGKLDVWIARNKGEDVAGAVFLRHEDLVCYKWGARRPGRSSNANHLLFWNAIEHFSRSEQWLDLGRADVRNHGLSRFKKEMGASPQPLPYSFFPRTPTHVSPEVPTNGRRALARIWTRMPLGATRLAGRALYRFLA